MNIRLCRLFNIFNKTTVVYSLILLSATLILGFIYNNFWSVLGVPFFSVLYCFNYSKFLKINRQTIAYRDFEIFSNLGRGKSYKYIHNEIIINVSKIEFHQNFIEKIFNVGHMEIIDDSLSKHTLYGITHFNVRKQEIDNYLKQE